MNMQIPASRVRGRTVALVLAEDDEDDVMLVEEALRECRQIEGIATVGDGAELLDYLRRQGDYADLAGRPLPGVVLLDLNMPKVGGMEALREIRSDPALRSLPVVVMTTSNARDSVQAAYAAGANSYIVKPANFDELVAFLDTVMEYWFHVAELPEIGV